MGYFQTFVEQQEDPAEILDLTPAQEQKKEGR